MIREEKNHRLIQKKKKKTLQSRINLQHQVDRNNRRSPYDLVVTHQTMSNLVKRNQHLDLSQTMTLEYQNSSFMEYQRNKLLDVT